MNKEVDIIYLINGSMGREIKSANNYAIQIFEELKNKYKDFYFSFEAPFYRDKIDWGKDKNEYFPLTDNMKDLNNKISKIEPYMGGDLLVDWVDGYNLELNNMNWRNGIK